MSRRRRSLAFMLAALAAAAGAAALADRYGSTVARGYGPLRPVVVTRGELSTGPIDPRIAASDLAVRRVPVRFAPADALASPAEAVGLATRAPLPAGSYLSASFLRPPHGGAPLPSDLSRRRSPVEIAVAGAGALLSAGAAPGGTKVDVIVSGDPAVGGAPARVAASGVPLLALRPDSEAVGPGTSAAATLGLTRRQALRLIAAEGEARRLTLLRRR